MKLCELAANLGIETYPTELEAIYENLPAYDGLATSGEQLTMLNEKYDLLGEYFETVLAGAEEIRNNEDLLTWLRVGYEYCRDASVYEARKFPIPVKDGSVGRDMFPALLLIREIPDAVKRYEARGFTEAQIIKNLGNIKINLWVHKITVGTVSLSQGLYNWLTLYTKALIVDHKGFNYQPNVWGATTVVLKNTNTSEYAIVMTTGTFNKDGLIVGSCGLSDEEGSFNADFLETTDMIFGHRSKGGKAQPTLEKFPKSEWKVVLRPGEDVVGLHIPRNTNLDPAYVAESFREGFELVKKLYPEISPKFLTCNSWLMETKLVDILGPDAKLSKFTTKFQKYPLKDTAGAGCLGYVWPGEKCEVSQYSEKTTLQRGIKKLMLEGDFIRTTGGIITDEL